MVNYTQLNTQLRHILDNFDLNQAMGGCSLTILHHGQAVIQLAHGVANLDVSHNPPITVPWTTDTLSLNFSTGKGVLVTLIHILVSQGLLDYDKPIAQYWTAFGAQHKQAITLRHVLTHSAQLFDIASLISHAKDMLDWQIMLNKIEQMSPMPSQSTDQPSAPAYSALVSGWVLGGLVEKVTGLSLQNALEYYLLAPLGLVGQIYFGVPTDKLPQIANQLREKTSRNKPTLVEDTDATLDFYQSLPFYQAWQTQSPTTDKKLTTQAINALYFDPSRIDPDDYKSALLPTGSRQFNYYHPTSLQAKIPAANGVASSFALATLYAMLANHGAWQGKQIISAPVIASLSQIHNQAFDKVMPAMMNWRLGFHRVFSVLHPTEHAYGHMGYNGSMAWCDPSRALAVAFTHNYDVTMLNDVRQFILNETILSFFDI